MRPTRVLLAIATREDDRQVRTQCPQLLKHLFSAEVRHRQIQDDRVVRIGKTLEQAHCDGEFMGIARFNDDAARQFGHALVELVERQNVTDDYFERAVDQFCAACTISAVDISARSKKFQLVKPSAARGSRSENARRPRG